MSRKGRRILIKGSEEFKEYCEKNGMCLRCGKMRVKRKDASVPSTEWQSIQITRDQRGDIEVYKGYHISPTCYTLAQAKDELGEVDDACEIGSRRPTISNQAESGESSQVEQRSSIQERNPRHLDEPRNYGTQSILPEIESLVKRKDIFSLICMLRSHENRQFDSAVSLMRLAREAERTSTKKSIELRDEIFSLGGMQALLALFRPQGAPRELQVTIALAVAYLLPSFVSSPLSLAVQLEVIECLRFLFAESPVALVVRGEVISRSEMSHASATGAARLASINDPEVEVSLNQLMLLNGSLLLESIKLVETEADAKPAPARQELPTSHVDSSHLVRRESPEIDTLVKRKDIFSLICMLRAPGEKRLDSALALLRFARNADKSPNAKAQKIRDKISSLGGIHCMIALFRSPDATKELKVIASLAIAYILPSYVKSSDSPSSNLGLKIVKSLHFLFTTSNPVTPRGEEISVTEMRQASIMGVHIFWFYSLARFLNNKASYLSSENALLLKTVLSTTRRRRLEQNPNEKTQPPEQYELQELLNLTVSLVTFMAKSNGNLTSFFFPMVQHMCTVDVARPIAVRKGLLEVLLKWMRSRELEKVRCATISVNLLACTQDDYMAGWIHSQIVEDGVLAAIVDLSLSETEPVGEDVQLAVAEILLTLCTAPHTRKAAYDAKCIQSLINMLNIFGDDMSQKVAFAAGKALLQLLIGTTPGKQDFVIDDIVNGGAISQFVAMARSSTQGKLRTMAVEAIRILSEDNMKSGNTRLRLCEDGAAGALGRVLKDDIEGDGSDSILVRLANDQQDNYHDGLVTSHDESVIKELHQALCAWTNILDMNEEPFNMFVLSNQESSAFIIKGAEEILAKGCSEFLETGGLESLLYVATLPIGHCTGKLSETLDQADLVVEACRSLASLAPLLLSSGAASRGHAACSVIVLEALTRTLCNTANSDGTEYSDILSELKFDALCGVAALANYEPHKLIIIDKYLPTLVHVKSSRGGDDFLFVAGAANQVLTSLGLAEDDFATQIAGNDPSMMGDWFCMHRSLVIQSMARAELHKILAYVWNTPFQDILSAGLIPAGLGRASSKESASSSTLLQSRESSTSSNLSANKSRIDSGGEIRALDDVFEALAFEAEGLDSRNTMLQQYHDVYEMDSAVRSAISSEAMLSWRSGESETGSLLATHVYPLNSTEMEKDWILSHRQFMQRADSKPSSIDAPDGLVSGRVQQLLDSCIPSRLIQQDVLPLFDLRPESPFDFRSLMMPQRRYFSFRREGQLVAHLCDTNASFTGSDDVFWTLGFTNSSFAGEFSETLVQSLYRCPLIRGISFTRDDYWRSVWKREDQDDAGLLGADQITKFVEALPSSISSITFDNTLNDEGFATFVARLKMVGRQTTEIPTFGKHSPDRSLLHGMKFRGSFHSVAVKNSPALDAKLWHKFLDLVCESTKRISSLEAYPLQSLKVLDISGNYLGDVICSLVLKRALDKESGCSLEYLDMSENAIREGSFVAKVLNQYRQDTSSSIFGMMDSRKAPLAYLSLASNQLNVGNLALELIALLESGLLGLKSLDLSDNSFKCQEYHKFTNVLLGLLAKNTCLQHLNLSNNEFSSECIDRVLDGWKRADFDSSLAFLRFQNNVPPLSDSQQRLMNECVRVSKAFILQRYFHDLERRNGEDIVEAVDFEDGLMETHSQSVSEPKRISDESVCSDSSSSISEGTFGEFDGVMGKHSITVLHSAPLVFKSSGKKLEAFAKLDFDKERELFLQCFKETRRDIHLLFDNATSIALLKVMDRRCSCVHYSGHSYNGHLPFEDGKGGANWLGVQQLRDLIKRTKGEPFKLAFVSACDSEHAGNTFVHAGVPHVVCCQQDSEVNDSAALEFTHQFYFSLTLGHTVQDSFEQGCRAVSAATEKEKFILLPRGAAHDTSLFADAKPVPKWPPPTRKSLRHTTHHSPWSPPTPPLYFLGREIDMYHLLDALLANRLVTVTGEDGIGKSSLVRGVCQYINERKRSIIEIDCIMYVEVKPRSSISSLLWDLLRIRNKAVDGIDWHSVRREICNIRRYNKKMLLVIDRVDCLAESNDLNDLIMLLSVLFKEKRARKVKVVLTGRTPLGVRSIAGVPERHHDVGPLNYESTVKLFCSFCRLVQTSAERNRLKAQLLSINENDVQSVYRALGNGVPKEIEETAWSIPPEELHALVSVT